ncbi:MAG: fluoride efflux transporter CrcB [Shewanellaceae bacterium]|nr:fluoride efflux transporter CrcB [Shewanellaceae bacterium]
MQIWLWVAVGGAVGACARFGVNQWVVSVTSWPIATLLVNAIGSGGMGWMMGYYAPILATDSIKFAIIVGVLGSFTTFSTFSYETWVLLQQGAWLKASLNILCNVLLCLVMVAAGHAIGKFFTY